MVRDDRKKVWWTIVETAVLAVKGGPYDSPDDTFLQVTVDAAIAEMTIHFKTTQWTLEGLTSSTFRHGKKTYVTVVLIASVGHE